MNTAVVRVPQRVHKEVQAASRVTGRTTAEVFQQAWTSFKATPEFEAELKAAQVALSAGDIETVTDLVLEHAARSKAQRIREDR